LDDQGRLRISAALSTDDGALHEAARAAAEAFLDRAARPGGSDTDGDIVDTGGDGVDPGGDGVEPDLDARHRTDVRPLVSDLDAQRSIDEAILDHALAAHVTDRGGERYSVVISADLDTLTRHSDSRPTSHPTRHRHACRVVGHPETDLGGDATRRIACDCRVQMLVHGAYHAMAMGREIRTVTRALRIRDGGCAFPGCQEVRWVDAHHIIHWADGGGTDLDNLVLLCRRHHRLVHEHGWTIQGHPRPGRLRCIDHRGHVVGRPGTEAPPGPVELRLAPDAAVSLGGGEPLTRFGLDVMVEHLLTG
jgi:hypothetical protein